MPIKIVDWLTFEEAEDREEGDDEHEAALVAHMKAEGLKICGFSHQGSYTPLFDDSKVFSVSYRYWGHLMAEVLDLPFEPIENPYHRFKGKWSAKHGEEERQQLERLSEKPHWNGNYIHWAWTPPEAEEEVLP